MSTCIDSSKPANPLYQIHDHNTIFSSQETTPTTQPASTPPTARTYTIALRVHNFVCRMSDAAELQLSLYDAAGNKMTEHLLLRWPVTNFNPAQVVFTVSFVQLLTDFKRKENYTFDLCMQN